MRPPFCIHKVHSVSPCVFQLCPAGFDFGEPLNLDAWTSWATARHELFIPIHTPTLLPKEKEPVEEPHGTSRNHMAQKSCTYPSSAASILIVIERSFFAWSKHDVSSSQEGPLLISSLSSLHPARPGPGRFPSSSGNWLRWRSGRNSWEWCGREYWSRDLRKIQEHPTEVLGS